jgi:hypothetical protein
MQNEETKSGAGDFEQRLQGQPLRKIPPAWRAKILSTACGSDSRPSPLHARPSSWWRELLWPCPQAWAGLAAVWLVILAVHSVTRDPLPVREARKATTASRNVLLALKEQEQLLAELIGPPLTPSPADKPKPFIPQPRSERREDCSFA